MFGAQSTHAKLFVLRLYFDSEKNEILKDRDAAAKIEIIDELYEKEKKETTEESKDYYLQTSNFLGVKSDPVYFSPSPGNFILRAPYFEGTSKIDFYHQNNLKLAIDVADFATCNLNNKCESQNNENAENCIADCFPVELEKVKNQNSASKNNIKDNSNTNIERSEPLRGDKSGQQKGTDVKPKIPYFGLIVGIAMIIVAIGYGIYRLIKKQQAQ